MTPDPDRDRENLGRTPETEKVVTLIAATLPSTYLLSGSLTVTALTAAVVTVVVCRRR